jgi:hypothetical protein
MLGGKPIQWHLLLLYLAGRVDDDVMTGCRSMLAEDRLGDIGPTIVAALQERRVPLAREEIDFLAELVQAEQVQMERLEITDAPISVSYEFASESPHDVMADVSGEGSDRAAIEAAAECGVAIGLWRAWRLPTAGAPSPSVKRVYSVETDDDADVVAMTADIQRALAAASEPYPQVEVYPIGIELANYQRLVQTYGELLWAREPDRGIRIAGLFDFVDPTLGPRFRSDHPTVDSAELDVLASYLSRGEALLLTTGRVDDVVDPSRENAVPMSFRTDGTWVWSDATTYYLGVHRLLPDPDLTAHIRASGYVVPAVDAVAYHRAMAALRMPQNEEPAWTFG